MEQYDGIAILATNLREHLDEAFTRRLQFVIDFPFPGELERSRIWEVCLPPGTLRGDDVDVERLGRDFRLSGGNIKNAAVHAAFLAAAADSPIRHGPSPPSRRAASTRRWARSRPAAQDAGALRTDHVR